MDDLCTIIGHLYDFIVIQLAQDSGIGELFGVGVHDALHVLPDGLSFCIQQVGEDGGGIIAAFAAKRCAFVFIRGADKSLGHDHIVLFEQGGDLCPDLCWR